MADPPEGDPRPALARRAEAVLHGARLAALTAQLARCLARTAAGEAPGAPEPSLPPVADLGEQLRGLAALLRTAEVRLKQLPALCARLAAAEMEAEDLRGQLEVALRRHRALTLALATTRELADRPDLFPGRPLHPVPAAANVCRSLLAGRPHCNGVSPYVAASAAPPVPSPPDHALRRPLQPLHSLSNVQAMISRKDAAIQTSPPRWSYTPPVQSVDPADTVEAPPNDHPVVPTGDLLNQADVVTEPQIVQPPAEPEAQPVCLPENRAAVHVVALRDGHELPGPPGEVRSRATPAGAGDTVVPRLRDIKVPNLDLAEAMFGSLLVSSLISSEDSLVATPMTATASADDCDGDRRGSGGDPAALWHGEGGSGLPPFGRPRSAGAETVSRPRSAGTEAAEEALAAMEGAASSNGRVSLWRMRQIMAQGENGDSCEPPDSVWDIPLVTPMITRLFSHRFLSTLRRRSHSFLQIPTRQGLRSQSDQQRMHQEGIYWAIKEGRRDAVRRLAQQDPSVLTRPDAVGANPIHIAFLYRQTEIGKMLVEEYPQLATSVYGEGEYSGENILHIAIIHQDVELVRWLLNRDPELLNAETTGSFFAPSGDVYFGGYPLLFAAASNQVDIVRCILATRRTTRRRKQHHVKNEITTVDRFGNTALHLAVIHELPDIYDFVLEEMYRQGLSAVDVRRLFNAEGLTPLALAAAMGQDRMFQHILAKSSVVAWDYGPITCKLFPLGGLEQPFIDTKTGVAVKTAIACLCSGAQNPVTQCLKLADSRIPRHVEQVRLDLVVSAEVRQVLDKKWDAFGQRMFYRKLAVALGTVLAWTAASIVPNHYRCAGHSPEDHPLANLVIRMLELLALLPVMWRAGWFAWSCRPSSRLRVETHGAASVEAALGNVFRSLYLASLAFRFAEEPMLVDVTAAFAALTGWLHVFFFLLGFRSTGPFVIMIKEMVQYDLRRFLSVNLAVLFGFTMSLHMLTSSAEHCGFDAFAERLWQLVLLGLVGDFPFKEYNERFTGGRMLLIELLFTLYIILVVILLLNLLIAMMGNTYAAVQDQAEKRWYLERANLMAAYEAEHTVDEMQQLRKQFATPFGQSDAAVTRDTEFCLTTTVRSEEWKLSSARRAGSTDDPPPASPP